VLPALGALRVPDRRAGGAIGLALTYAAVTVLRSSIQPKLLGDQLGLPPLAALAALYVGWRVWGIVWGC
jgi:predicted PurR-regulated permease PerM